MGKQAEAIAEGVSIALSAARLALKNEILVETIAGDANYDDERFAPAGRKILKALAKEAEGDAARLKRQGRKAWGKYSMSDGTHDYRDRDVRNLRRRRKQSEGVASRLRAVADDPKRLGELVEQAREAAWTDVASNLDRRLRAESAHFDEDPDYATMREARMQALAMVDLQALETQVKARKKFHEKQAARKADKQAQKQKR